jgi:heme-degrading monooxygenase HmoA
MILEVAFVPVLEDRKAEFETTIAAAVESLLSKSEGYLGFTFHGWGIERPNIYMFSVKWETLEHHTIGFRESDRFTEWRSIIGPFFDGAPLVEHFAV